MKFNFIKKKLVIVLCLNYFFFNTYYSQETTTDKHYPSVLFGVGAMKFTGDVGSKSNLNPLLDARIAYYLKAEYRLGKYLGIMAGGVYGKLAGNDFSDDSKLNFESTAMQADLSLVTYFDHFFKNNDKVSPFLSAGLGYLMFDPYGDLKNGSSKYYYWADGSIKDLPESAANNPIANIIKRDYTYESQLKDSTNNYSRSSLCVPVGIGLDWQIGSLHRWDVQIGCNYNLIFSDYVDNYKSGGDDSYLMAHIGVKYTFAPKPKTPASEVNFTELEKFDYDEDGVPDDVDNCLSTPKGVTVDKNGCPPDGDNDGVPDYKDKEINTVKGSFVDEYGIAVNLDSVAYRQIMNDSAEVARRNQMDAEKKVDESNNVKVVNLNDNNKNGSNETNSKHNKLPAEIRPADLNKDGIISVEEIARIIDGFFEGNNDFNVERINKLIDFFFDQ